MPENKNNNSTFDFVQLLVGPMDVFAYLVACPETKKTVVVDPGAEPDRILAEAQKRSWTIEALINTHHHSDHIAANGAVHRATKCKVIAHTETARALSTVRGGAMLQFLGGDIPPPDVDITVEDGDTIPVGNQHLDVIHTPGHTPGDISLYWPGHVMTGDTLFVGGFGRTDLPGGSTRILQRSLKERLFTLPPDTIVLPGHDYGISRTSTIAQQARELAFFLDE